VTIFKHTSAFVWIKAELASGAAKNATQPMKFYLYIKGRRTMGRKKKRAAVTP